MHECRRETESCQCEWESKSLLLHCFSRSPSFSTFYQGSRKALIFITSFHSLCKQNCVYSYFHLEFYIVTLIINMLVWSICAVENENFEVVLLNNCRKKNPSFTLFLGKLIQKRKHLWVNTQLTLINNYSFYIFLAMFLIFAAIFAGRVYYSIVLYRFMVLVFWMPEIAKRL